MRTSVREYDIIEKLGQGSYGMVYKGKKKTDGKFCVIKEINLRFMDQNEKNAAIYEGQLLKTLDNFYVVKYYDMFQEADDLFIVMEYCENGDLLQYIKKLKAPLQENKIWSFFLQMLLGLNYLHENRIIHRDFKTMNMFLTHNCTEIRIGDLGVAKKLSQNQLLAKTVVGTPYFLSPEICEEKPYSEKSDVWSLGCVIYELATLKHPFEASNQQALIIKILKNKHDPLPSTLSRELQILVNLLLTKDQIKRPDTIALLKNAMIQEKIGQFKIGALTTLQESILNTKSKNNKRVRANSNVSAEGLEEIKNRKLPSTNLHSSLTNLSNPKFQQLKSGNQHRMSQIQNSSSYNNASNESQIQWEDQQVQRGPSKERQSPTEKNSQQMKSPEFLKQGKMKVKIFEGDSAQISKQKKEDLEQIRKQGSQTEYSRSLHTNQLVGSVSSTLNFNTKIYAATKGNRQEGSINVDKMKGGFGQGSHIISPSNSQYLSQIYQGDDQKKSRQFQVYFADEDNDNDNRNGKLPEISQRKTDMNFRFSEEINTQPSFSQKRIKNERSNSSGLSLIEEKIDSVNLKDKKFEYTKTSLKGRSNKKKEEENNKNFNGSKDNTAVKFFENSSFFDSSSIKKNKKEQLYFNDSKNPWANNLGNKDQFQSSEIEWMENTKKKSPSSKYVQLPQIVQSKNAVWTSVQATNKQTLQEQEQTRQINEASIKRQQNGDKQEPNFYANIYNATKKLSQQHSIQLKQQQSIRHAASSTSYPIKNMGSSSTIPNKQQNQGSIFNAKDILELEHLFALESNKIEKKLNGMGEIDRQNNFQHKQSAKENKNSSPDGRNFYRDNKSSHIENQSKDQGLGENKNFSKERKNESLERKGVRSQSKRLVSNLEEEIESLESQFKQKIKEYTFELPFSEFYQQIKPKILKLDSEGKLQINAENIIRTYFKNPTPKVKQFRKQYLLIYFYI